MLYDTKKVPANNKSIHCRCAVVHSCTFLQVCEDKIPAVPNCKGKKQCLYNSSDLDWDLDHGYLEIRGAPCDPACESCKKHIDGQEISHPKTGWLWLCHVQHACVVAAKHEHAAEAMVASSKSDCSDCPSLELTDDECDDNNDSMPSDNNDDTFNPDAVPASFADFDISDQPELLDYIKCHVDFCCGSLSFAIAKLTTDKTCCILTIDILPSKEVKDSCPEELCSQLIYCKLDLLNFMY